MIKILIFMLTLIMSNVCFSDTQSNNEISDSVDARLPDGSVVKMNRINLDAEGIENIKLKEKDMHQLLKKDVNGKKNTLPNIDNYKVLDQGKHGSCMTFAITGASDYLLGKSDSISQLCLLNLRRSGVFPVSSGWDGLNSFHGASDYLLKYGYMSISDQVLYGCGSIYYYPTYSDDIGDDISADYYKQFSNPVHISFIEHDSTYGTFTEEHAQQYLSEIKRNIDEGNPTAIAIITKEFDDGTISTTKYRQDNDTFIDPPYGIDTHNSGHGLFVIGYDDDATINYYGEEIKGLLKVRNSWGLMGDHGNYYIPYEYFIKYAENVLFMNHAKNDNNLHTNTTLYTDQEISSLNGVYTLVMQGDCNLVEYKNNDETKTKKAVWSTKTDNKGEGCYATMQDDCNLVIYDKNRRTIFDSQTSGDVDNSCYLTMQDDSNVVIYAPNGIPIWDRYKV